MKYIKENNPLFSGREIRTYSGLYIDVFDPKPEMFTIMDIAVGLSRNIRFRGHGLSCITVAEHSLNVTKHVKTIEDRRAALLHDASEAYLGDIASPIKQFLPDYKALENKVMKAIAIRFGFDYPISQAVKDADRFELEREWHQTVLRPGIAMSQSLARDYFTEYFDNLFGE